VRQSFWNHIWSSVKCSRVQWWWLLHHIIQGINHCPLASTGFLTNMLLVLLKGLFQKSLAINTQCINSNCVQLSQLPAQSPSYTLVPISPPSAPAHLHWITRRHPHSTTEFWSPPAVTHHPSTCLKGPATHIHVAWIWNRSYILR